MEVVQKRKSFLISDKLHPQTIACVETRSKAMGMKVSIVDFDQLHPQDIDKETSAILLQYPDTHGSISDLQALIDRAHAAGV